MHAQSTAAHPRGKNIQCALSTHFPIPCLSLHCQKLRLRLLSICTPHVYFLLPRPGASPLPIAFATTGPFSFTLASTSALPITGTCCHTTDVHRNCRTAQHLQVWMCQKHHHSLVWVRMYQINCPSCYGVSTNLCACFCCSIASALHLLYRPDHPSCCTLHAVLAWVVLMLIHVATTVILSTHV